MTYRELYDDAIALLRELVKTPSFSREEGETADILAGWLKEKLGTGDAESGEGGEGGIHRHRNNVWVRNRHFDPVKPTILLCSHHDTVRPNGVWTRDPFDATIDVGEDVGREREGKSDGGEHGGARLHGLGSNDAGASVVSLAAAFRHFYDINDLRYNLILALVAEEEISGPGGIRSILQEMGLDDANSGALDFAIVGEPTMRARARELAHDAEGMQMAIAEKGLMVLDCMAHGRSGHAARDEGDNAIYHAIKDIEWFRTFRFPRVSPLFGEVKMSVTMISAGTQHNVVPAECRFTVDVRVTEQYTNEEVLDIVRQHVACDVVPRSTHLRSSSIPTSHPIVQAGISLGLTTFGSPTTSDQVALDIPSVKIGPGLSERSHSADEYIELAEIGQGIELYIKLLEKIL